MRLENAEGEGTLRVCKPDCIADFVLAGVVRATRVAGLLHTLATLGEHPESVPINALVALLHPRL